MASLRNCIKISNEGCKIQLCLFSIFLQGNKCTNAVSHVCTATAEITTVPQAVKSLLLEKKWRAFVWGRGGGWQACMQLCAKGRELVEFTWQSGNLAPWLVVSRVAVWRQQAADNLQETDKLDIYTERLQSKGLVTAVHRLRISGRDLVRNVLLVPYLTETPFFWLQWHWLLPFSPFQKKHWKHFCLFSLSTGKFLFKQTTIMGCIQDLGLNLVLLILLLIMKLFCSHLIWKVPIKLLKVYPGNLYPYKNNYVISLQHTRKSS